MMAFSLKSCPLLRPEISSIPSKLLVNIELIMKFAIVFYMVVYSFLSFAFYIKGMGNHTNAAMCNKTKTPTKLLRLNKVEVSAWCAVVMGALRYCARTMKVLLFHFSTTLPFLSSLFSSNGKLESVCCVVLRAAPSTVARITSQSLCNEEMLLTRSINKHFETFHSHKKNHANTASPFGDSFLSVKIEKSIFCFLVLNIILSSFNFRNAHKNTKKKKKRKKGRTEADEEEEAGREEVGESKRRSHSLLVGCERIAHF
jgi:hypothetical protein